VDRALAFLSNRASTPRFLYLHPADPRDPYAPPEALARAADPEYKGSFKLFPRTLETILRGEQEVSEEDLRHARALYAAEVVSMDRELGRLFDALRERIESGRTILVFTSDHGEEFLEHDALGHGHALYQELIHVPLLVVQRGGVRPGTVISDPVTHLDIAPTILALAGLPPEPVFSGRSLSSIVDGSAAALAEFDIVSEENVSGNRTTSHRIRMARRGAWKVILYSPDVFEIGPWRRETFNLGNDPAERESLPPGTAEADSLAERLRARVAGEPEGSAPNGEPAPEADHPAGSPEGVQ